MVVDHEWRIKTLKIIALTENRTYNKIEIMFSTEIRVLQRASFGLLWDYTDHQTQWTSKVLSYRSTKPLIILGTLIPVYSIQCTLLMIACGYWSWIQWQQRLRNWIRKKRKCPLKITCNPICSHFFFFCQSECGEGTSISQNSIVCNFV